jgi:predicted  nucleic acid-binding Zn-ribbon protein
MTLSEISFELSKAQTFYEEKAKELNDAQSKKEEAEIALIRADSSYKRLRLEVTVMRSRVESLKDQSYNLRQEAKL